MTSLKNCSWKRKNSLIMVMAENLSHHFHNRHEGFMQPILVETQHHFDFKILDNDISKSLTVSIII